MSVEKRTKSIDLSHHLSELSKARPISPLKGLMKYFTQPGILSLAGGLHFSSFNLNISYLT
jgi:aromatic amino acid aminotransferase I